MATQSTIQQSCQIPPLARQSLASIAVAVPGATQVFRSHDLDFCCHGNVPLKDAAAAAGINLTSIIAELEALEPSATTAAPEQTPALIDYILSRYHQVHRAEMPELIRLARRVEHVHRQHPAVPGGLADLLDDTQRELESHMEKEEQILFPMMKTNGCPLLAPPIARMRGEHDEHGARLRRILALTDNCQIPAEACASWRALYAGVRKLVDDLMEHIHLENNILFPRFERR